MYDEDEDTIEVNVERVIFDGGTVAEGIGYDISTGEVIRFGGDSRMMHDIAMALFDGETPTATVPPWAVLTRA